MDLVINKTLEEEKNNDCKARRNGKQEVNRIRIKCNFWALSSGCKRIKNECGQNEQPCNGIRIFQKYVGKMENEKEKIL